MNNTIFELVREKPTEGKDGFLEMAKNAPQPKDDSYLNSIADYAKTFLKGSIEGMQNLSNIMAPSIRTPEIKEGKFQFGLTPSERSEKLTESLDELLPTDERYIQRSLRRGLNQAPSTLAFPGTQLSSLPRSIIAGFAGEGAKSLNLPEWAQTAAELTAYIGPDITKKLLKTGSNKEIIEFAKKMGMTDEQITPLLQSEFKQKWLSKLSPKRGSTEVALKNTKKGLQESYNSIQKSEKALVEISEIENGKLINSLMEKIDEMPSHIKSEIEKDLQELLNNKITGRSLMNFFKDINSKFSQNTNELSLLKKPITDALKTISPEVAKDFEMVNNLYTKYYRIASRLKPNLMSDIIGAGKALGIGISTLGALTVGYYPPLIHLLGEKAASKLAQHLLINPRLQQLSEKMIIAMNENKFGVIKKLIKSFVNQIKNQSPETARALENISDKDLEEFLMNQKEKAE